MNSPITDRTAETAFHVAVGANQVKFVKWLVRRPGFDVSVKDRKGNTAFCTAAISGASEIIKLLRPRNTDFPIIRGGAEMTPLYMAALFGHNAIASDLYLETRPVLLEKETKWLFFICIHNEIFGKRIYIHIYNRDSF